MDDPDMTLLRELRDVLAGYAQNHRDKRPATAETLHKALVNERLVAKIDARLAEKEAG
jgi:hypothetical protein